MNFWNSLRFLHFKQQGKIQKPYIPILFNSATKLVFFGQNWVGKMPHKWYFGQTNQIIPNQTSLREKKSIMVYSLNWCQKLSAFILVTNTNSIFKNILVKVPFWSKTSVPYESWKREKNHISYIIHPRTISLAESRGSRSFFILKSGVHFSFWACLNFAYLLQPTLIEFSRQRGRSMILMTLISHTLLALVSCPPFIFGVTLKKSQIIF